MYTEWKSTTRYIVGVSLFLFGLVIIYLSRSVLTMLVIAALIAFLVRPLIGYLCKRLRVPRSVVVLTTYLLVTIVLLLAPLILLPPIIDAVNFLLNLDYEALTINGVQWSQDTLSALKSSGIHLLGVNIVLDSIVDPILSTIENAGTGVIPELPSLPVIINSAGQAFVVSYGVAVDVAGTLFSGFIAFIFLIISSIYLSLDGVKLFNRFVDNVPKAYRSEIVILQNRLTVIWDAFFRGQVTLMVIIGTVVWLGLTILGLPGAVALGIIAGLLEIIPNLGPFLAAIPAVIVALLQGSEYFAVNNFIFALIVIGFYVLVQSLENTLVVPRVMGESVQLHPLVIIIGVLVGASVGGILGALLAAPVIASGREIVHYLYRRALGENPFPPEQDKIDATQVSLRESIEELKNKAQELLMRETESDQAKDEIPAQKNANRVKKTISEHELEERSQ
ncbi:MAG: AI-2E family transporter [Anaerolineales bacterium]